jgi:hypothetical protein
MGYRAMELHVHSGKLVDSKFNKVVTVDCSYETSPASGEMFRGRMMMPPRLFPDVLLMDDNGEHGEVKPRLMVYLGSKQIGDDKTCFEVNTVTSPEGTDLTEQAAALRLLSTDQLRAKFHFKSIGDFPDNTIFICSGLSHVKRGSDSLPVMSYETTVNGESVRGEAFLPARTYADVKRMERPVVLMYKGLHPRPEDARTLTF